MPKAITDRVGDQAKASSEVNGWAGCPVFVPTQSLSDHKFRAAIVVLTHSVVLMLVSRCTGVIMVDPKLALERCEEE